MSKLIKKLVHLHRNEKRYFCEAYIILGLMRAGILFLPFKWLTRTLELKQNITETSHLIPAEMRTSILIGNAIQRAAKYTPWESACLAQALTAQKMLQRRSIPGVFYLGVRKNVTIQEKMKAHAWSQYGETILTGKTGHKNFIVVSAFTWERK
jgi:hypothetical protein